MWGIKLEFAVRLPRSILQPEIEYSVWGWRDRWGETPSSLVGRAKDLWLKLHLLTTLFTCNQRQVYWELIYWDLGFRASLPYMGLQCPGRISELCVHMAIWFRKIWKKIKIFQSQLVKTAVSFLPWPSFHHISSHVGLHWSDHRHFSGLARGKLNWEFGEHFSKMTKKLQIPTSDIYEEFIFFVYIYLYLLNN